MNPAPRTVPGDPSDGDPWDRLKTLYLALIEALAEERHALAEADAGALESCVAHKNALCRALADAQRALTAETPSGSDDVTHGDPRVDEIRELARRAREQNGINGHMAHRARQTVRTLLDVLTGTEQPVYGPPQHDHQPPSTGVGHSRYQA